MSQHETIVGIDPGPKGFAWALLLDGRFDDWDEYSWGVCCVFSEKILQSAHSIAVEEFSAGRILGNASRETIKSIGRIQALYDNVLLIPRVQVASSLGLGGRQKRGDAQINRAMCVLYPELRGRQKGLNSHTRAACAVAHAAVGKLQAKAIEEGI